MILSCARSWAWDITRLRRRTRLTISTSGINTTIFSLALRDRQINAFRGARDPGANTPGKRPLDSLPAAARYSLPRYCAILRCPLTGSTQLSATRPVAIFRPRDCGSQTERKQDPYGVNTGCRRGGQEPADNCMCKTKAKLRCPRVFLGNWGLICFFSLVEARLV